MTLTGMKKHVGVLEHAGLVATAKVGRVRTCTLGQRRLDEVTAWIDRYRQLWRARFDAARRGDRGIEAETEREHPDEERHDGGTEIRARGRHHAHLQRPCAARVRGVDYARADAPMVGSEVERPHAAVVRDGRPHRRHVPLRFPHPSAPEPMAFFGRYLEVLPHSRLVWTNEEGGDAGHISTLTLEDRGDTTRMVLHALSVGRSLRCWCGCLRRNAGVVRPAGRASRWIVHRAQLRVAVTSRKQQDLTRARVRGEARRSAADGQVTEVQCLDLVRTGRQPGFRLPPDHHSCMTERRARDSTPDAHPVAARRSQPRSVASSRG